MENQEKERIESGIETIMKHYFQDKHRFGKIKTIVVLSLFAILVAYIAFF